MASIRHKPQTEPDDALLDAARHCIVAVGWKRTTLTDVARRAGVSRMTIYRRWPDMQTLLADLMTREWAGVVAGATLGEGASPVDRLASGVSATVAALRDNELFRRIVHVDPELLLPYLLDRRGRTQETILTLLEDAIADGQREGSVRLADPVLLARSILLAAHGFALSAETMVEELPTPAGAPRRRRRSSRRSRTVTVADLDAELGLLIERYLRT